MDVHDRDDGLILIYTLGRDRPFHD